MEDLFSESDLDQEMLEKEKQAEKALIEKKIESEKNKKTAEEKKYDKVLYIIDGYSLIYRSYFAFLSRPLTDRRGNNISAYYGFFNTLLSLMSQYRMDYLAVCMDEKEATFRHRMYPEYKANRMKAPEDLHAEVPLIEETLALTPGNDVCISLMMPWDGDVKKTSISSCTEAALDGDTVISTA